MPKVLVVVTDFPPLTGGLSRVLYDICRALPPEDVVVLAPWGCNYTFLPGYDLESRRPAREFDAQQRFRIHRAPYSQKTPLWTFLSVIRFSVIILWLLARERPTLVYFAQPFPYAVSGPLIRLLGVPYVLHTHGTELLRPRRALADIMRRATLRWAFRVIATSQWTRKTLTGMGIDSTKTAVIRPKVDLSQFQCPGDIEAFKGKEDLAGKRIILTVARLDMRKGQHLVIRALPEVLREHPDVVYVIAGTGPDQQLLQDEVKRCGVSDHVYFPGNRDIVAFYYACDLFIMPSLGESFGIVYIEASACGKAVVGSNVGGIPDAVQDGVSGLLVEPNSVDSVTSALKKLLADPELCARLGRQGYERVTREFTFNKYASELQEFVFEPLQVGHS